MRITTQSGGDRDGFATFGFAACGGGDEDAGGGGCE